jgi:hypothetical protein
MQFTDPRNPAKITELAELCSMEGTDANGAGVDDGQYHIGNDWSSDADGTLGMDCQPRIIIGGPGAAMIIWIRVADPGDWISKFHAAAPGASELSKPGDTSHAG